MPVLRCNARAVAAAEVARTLRARTRGLLGRSGIAGALVLEPANAVHTLGMRFPIDAAFCDRDGVVRRVATLHPWRLTRPARGIRCVVEAQAGSFARWGIRPGDRLTVDPGAAG